MSQILNTDPVEGSSIDVSSLDTTVALKSTNLSNDYKSLITKLLQIHGTGMLHFSPTTKSYELRIPDPILLNNDGPKELFSRHLYINLTKYIDQHHGAAARCVKNGKVYRIIELLNNYRPLKERGYSWDVDRFLGKCKNKLFIPDKDLNPSADFTEVLPPGDVIPITTLPKDHPAIMYLKSRNFSDSMISELYKQFETSFCISEAKGTSYYDEYHGLGKSPKGKLIFYVKHFGELKGWQSRVIEKVEGSTKYYYTYFAENDPRNGWVPVATYNDATRSYNAFPRVPGSLLKHKYVIAYGTKKADCILGLDAAIEFNKTRTKEKYVVITEGALDAGKFGSPACCVFGNRISVPQCKLLINNFDKIYYALDHDLAGNTLEISIQETLIALGFSNFAKIEYPKQFKDIGEIDNISIIEQLKEKL